MERGPAELFDSDYRDGKSPSFLARGHTLVNPLVQREFVLGGLGAISTFKFALPDLPGAKPAVAASASFPGTQANPAHE